MYTLEERLRLARQHANLTQPQLAELVGVSRRTMVNYEKDASKAAVPTVQNIAIACKIDEIWLLTGHGEMTGSSKQTNPDNSTPPHPDLVDLFEQQDLAWDINWDLLHLEKLDKKELEEVSKFVKYRLFRKQQADKTKDEQDLNDLREKEDAGRNLKDGTYGK